MNFNIFKKKNKLEEEVLSERPYIICVENNTDKASGEVEILDSSNNMFIKEYEKGKIKITTDNGVDVSLYYGIPNVTLTQFYASIASGVVFKIGRININAVKILGIEEKTHYSKGDSTTEQCQQIMVVETRDINGNYVGRPLIPMVDNYQTMLNKSVLHYDFLVNVLTSLRVKSILPDMRVYFYLYPMRKKTPQLNTNPKKSFMQKAKDFFTGLKTNIKMKFNSLKK